MSIHRKRSSRGFSLVEIMVIVIILGMLIAAGVVSYSNAVDQARDEHVKASMEQVRSNLELYKRNRTNQVYPNTLADLRATGYEIPDHPETDDLAGYNYTPSPAGCEVTSSCSGYEMTTLLRSEEAQYIASPQSLKTVPTEETPENPIITIDPTYVAGLTPTIDPLTLPTSTPIPTSTPVPTLTPVPTSTPIPTSTPLPTLTPTPSAHFAIYYPDTRILEFTIVAIQGNVQYPFMVNYADGTIECGYVASSYDVPYKKSTQNTGGRVPISISLYIAYNFEPIYGNCSNVLNNSNMRFQSSILVISGGNQQNLQ